MESVLMKIKDELCNVVQSYAEKGINNADDVQVVKNALSGIYKIKIIKEMERFGSGFSERMSYERGGSYRRDGRSYADDGSSYRRGGRSYRDGYDGYSGHDLKEHLKMLMENADPQERELINSWMQAI